MMESNHSLEKIWWDFCNEEETPKEISWNELYDQYMFLSGSSSSESSDSGNNSDQEMLKVSQEQTPDA